MMCSFDPVPTRLLTIQEVIFGRRCRARLGGECSFADHGLSHAGHQETVRDAGTPDPSEAAMVWNSFHAMM